MSLYIPSPPRVLTDSSALLTYWPTDLKTCPMDEPQHCPRCEPPRLSFFTSLSSPFFPSFLYFPSLSPFHPLTDLFILLLSLLPSLSILTVALLNKWITHVVELIRRSFSSAPYGPTAMLHKVFKVTTLQPGSVKTAHSLPCVRLELGRFQHCKKCFIMKQIMSFKNSAFG